MTSLGLRPVVRRPVSKDTPDRTDTSGRNCPASEIRPKRTDRTDRTDRDMNNDRLAEAKARLSRAAERYLRNEPGAAEEADAARAEVDALRAIERARLCAFDGCQTITVELFCWRHRLPPATAGKLSDGEPGAAEG